MSKLFIDPGHGGRDPGAIGKCSNEKDNVLKVGLRLKTLLESWGHTVRLSRSTDIYLTLSERAKMANDWKADYFLSLHDNSAVTKSATGFETFVYNGPIQSETLGFQNAIHTAIVKGIGIRDRGKKRANFAVLRETRMPAVLIEYAFITNTSDEKILIDEVEKLSKLTTAGIINFVSGAKPTPAPKPTQPKSNPSKPVEKPKANLVVDGYEGKLTIQAEQRYFGTPVDGIISRPSLLIKARQKLLGVSQDGYVGPITISAEQRRYGTYVDGVISRPSIMIKERQRRLNKGKL